MTFPVGFRICGMKVYQPLTKDYIEGDKAWGVALATMGVEVALRSYFDNGERFRYEVRSLPGYIVKTLLYSLA